MNFFNYRGHSQIVKNKDILCSCHWGSLYPDNYLEGLKVCKHIVELIKDLVPELTVITIK